MIKNIYLQPFQKYFCFVEKYLVKIAVVLEYLKNEDLLINNDQKQVLQLFQEAFKLLVLCQPTYGKFHMFLADKASLNKP